MKLRSKNSLVQKLTEDKAYRDAYVAEHVKNGIAFQLRSIRDEFEWSQAEMGKAVGKPQNVISRLENPNYGKPNIQTLLEIAAGLDMALMVKFVPFSRLLREYDDVSPAALVPKNISEEQDELRFWANTQDAFGTYTVPVNIALESPWAPLNTMPFTVPLGSRITQRIWAIPNFDLSARIVPMEASVGSVEREQKNTITHFVVSNDLIGRTQATATKGRTELQFKQGGSTVRDQKTAA